MLEVRVILHNANTGEVSEIANMTITQVERHAGTTRRNYEIGAWSVSPEWSKLPGRRTFSGEVWQHDRTSNVWTLVHKAIAALFWPDGI